uniref:1-phosphatidylinositol 4-kinase n=3 Tax=Oryza sativa subsp. japonica TaxID=39947 RepID=Q2R903_ORYSJ|nr:Phosphatidylinositol 4-kinase, putative, expressed [Oryza sativa Japonica Group]
MVRLLGLRSLSFGPEESPREITVAGGGGGDAAAHPVGSSGWLVRFFDSAFFCEWIAVSYLYKHDHQGVRDYLCNRMYTLPLPGLEAYLFQVCYMMVHKPSPSLDRFVIDTCSKSLRIALKVHWLLAAELELEDTDDLDGIDRVQEQCQAAATVQGEWPPLVRPAPPSPIASPRGNPMLSRIRSSKQRLLSLASSPSLGLSPPAGASNAAAAEDVGGSGVKQPATPSSEDNKLLKRLSIGPKVRDAASFFRRSVEKDDEQDKEGFFKRLLRDSKDKEEEDGDKEGFFKRLLSKEKENEEEEGDRDGFLRRLLRDSKDEDMELTPSSEGLLKRLFRDKEDRQGDDEEKEGFFRRIFKDKNEERRESLHGRHGDEERVGKSLEDDDKEGFFRKIFKDKNEERKDGGHSKQQDDKEKTAGNIEDDKRDGFFRQLFKEKNEEKKEGTTPNKKEEDDKGHRTMDDENFFRRLFKDKNEEKKGAAHDRNDDDKCEEGDKENFFRKLFKDKHEERRSDGLDKHDDDGCLECTLKMLRVGILKVVSLTKNSVPTGNGDKQSGKPPLPNNAIAELRKGCYYASLELVQSLCDTSYGLVDIFPMEDRKIALRESLTEINSQIASTEKNGGVCFPMGKGIYRVVHIPEDEAVLLNSREKAPYLICVEVLKAEAPSHSKGSSDVNKLSKGGIPLANGDVQLPKPPPWAYPLWSRHETQNYETDRMLKSTSQVIDQAMAQLWEAKVKFVNVSFSVEKLGRSRSVAISDSGHRSRQSTADSNEPSGDSQPIADQPIEWVKVTLSAVPGVNMDDVDDNEPTRKKDHRRVPSTIAIEEVKAAALKGEAPPGLPLKGVGQNAQNIESKATDGGDPKPTDALAGEIWAVKRERIRRSSVHGKLPGWDLRSVIVKSGDDCRQEHLAVQLVAHLYDIYQEAGLPLWLRPYEVIVTSAYTALIETIPDTASIHSIKSRFPDITSLRDYYVAKYEENSPNFKLAQRNFVESMAGYSILCYLLQVKDRHNGNLLIDEEGHIIHIDFGFMLSNSPGGVNFESAPFKLTRELLEVMDSDAEGTPSEFFDYFKVLCIQGFLTCRKHAERIILLVEMLQDSGFPCFKGGPRTIQNLRKRFHLSLTEEELLAPSKNQFAYIIVKISGIAQAIGACNATCIAFLPFDEVENCIVVGSYLVEVILGAWTGSRRGWSHTSRKVIAYVWEFSPSFVNITPLENWKYLRVLPSGNVSGHISESVEIINS